MLQSRLFLQLTFLLSSNSRWTQITIYLACRFENLPLNLPFFYPSMNHGILSLPLFHLFQVCSGQHTIHGLWPQWGESCAGEPFDLSALSPILTEMRHDWPSCDGPDTPEQFWQHEWEKHGTCSKLPLLQYFRTALQLYT